MPRTRALAPATVLFAILVAHSILETARDALFLSRLAPRDLAFAYIVMAGCALVAIWLARRSLRLRDPRRALIAFLGAATAGTLVLAPAVAKSDTLVFVLYVWTGFVATLVVPSFWVAIDRAFAISEAKRVFGAIGAGGVLGALVGSAIAGVVGRYGSATSLVWIGAVGFACATAVASLLVPRRVVDDPPARPSRVEARSRVSRRYVRTLVALTVVGMVALTLGDLTFKLVVADRVAARDLAAWFGGTYTALNAVGLVVQVLVTPRLLARWGVGAVLAVLPVIVLVSGVGFALTGAVLAVVVLKLGDGGLRHSLHRVGSEILYVPLPSVVRDGGKLVADALGQRGGQAIAATIAGGIVFFGGSVRLLAVATTVAAALWLVAVAFARRGYVQELRNSLQAGDIQRDVAVPKLDAASAELLERSIAGDDETEALAALDLLARRAQVPVVALRDPRETVVRHALSLLHGELPEPVAKAVAALDMHPDPHVRAAACAAQASTRPDLERLLRARDDAAVELRAVALVHLVDRPRHAERALADIATLATGPREGQIALVEAIAFVPHPRFAAILHRLLDIDDAVLQRAVLHTLQRAPDLADLSRLVPLLASRAVRYEVREAIIACGARALGVLIAALDDPQTPGAVRLHLPATIALFRSGRATLALSGRLVHEPDDRTADKLLRGVVRLRARDASLRVDVAALHEYLRRTVQRAAHYAVLHVEADVLAASRVVELIREILLEKHRIALQRSLRVLAALEPAARNAVSALESGDRARLGAARELVDAVAPRDIRAELLELLEGRVEPPRRTHDELVAALLGDPSESLRCAAALHVAEHHPVGSRAPALARLHV